MSSTQIFDHVNIAVACGPVPCDTAEGRKYLQDRLALYATVAFTLTAAMYVLLNTMTELRGSGGWQWFTDTTNAFHLGVCAVYIVTYLVVRLGSFSYAALNSLDLTVALFAGFFIGIDDFVRDSSPDPAFYGVLAISNVILARALLVPSSSPQAFGASLLSVAPVIIGFHYSSGGLAAVADSSTIAAAVGLSTPLMGAWCAVAVVIATVASHVIYGLRQQMQEAQQFGQYTLEERVGKGGMGEVFRASHALLRRPTAIKLLRPDVAG